MELRGGRVLGARIVERTTDEDKPPPILRWGGGGGPSVLLRWTVAQSFRCGKSDAGGKKNPSRRGRTSGQKKKVCHRGCPEIERQRTQLGRPPRESLVSHPWCEMESSTLAMRLFGANPMRSGSLGRRTPRLSCALAIESSAGSGVEGCCCGEELQEDSVIDS